MASLNTNVGAMTALQTLTATNKNLATTQSRISTGLRVAEASDNAAYWSIATTMRSDNKALSSIQDSLGLGAGKLDVAYTGMNAAIEVVDEMKQKLITAMGASDEDKGKIQSELKELQNQLRSIVSSANYAGSNLLSGDGVGTFDDDGTDVDGLSIASSYDRQSDGTTTVAKINVAIEDIVLLDDSDAGLLSEIIGAELVNDDATDIMDDEEIGEFLADIETALAGMADAASVLGAAKKRVDIQNSFVSKLSDAIDRGVGQLVDADMQEESARLSALQVQQQLGIQSLSIANSNSQNILSLFR